MCWQSSCWLRGLWEGPHTHFVILWQNMRGLVLMSSCLAGTVCRGLPALRNAQFPAHKASHRFFALASFTPVHNRMSIQMSSASSFPALHMTLFAGHQAQSSSNTNCVLEKLFPAPRLQPVRCIQGATGNTLTV